MKRLFSEGLTLAKLLQSCLTLCDPIDGSPPGSSVPGILQARILEWVAISFCMFCLRGTYVHSWVASLVICSSVNIYWAPVTCQVLWCLGYIKEQNRQSCNPYWQRKTFFFQLIWTNVKDWKRSVFIPIPKKGNAKECSNYCTIALISH